VDRTVLSPLGSVVNIFLGALGVAIIVISAVLGFGIPVAVVGGILYVIYRRLRPKKGNAGKK
jgi:Na+/serine symporter